jgi:hypothetical protein
VPLTALLFVPPLGEPLNAAQLAGGALVLAGIFVVNRAPSLKTGDLAGLALYPAADATEVLHKLLERGRARR